MRQLIFQIGLAKWAIFILDLTAYWVVVLLTGFSFHFFLQYLILCLACILGLYAFGAYDLVRVTDKHSRVIAACVGVLLGGIGSLPFLLLFDSRLHRDQFLSLLFFGFFVTSLTRTVIVQGLKNLMPERSTIVIGKQEIWGELLSEIREQMSGKMIVTDFFSYTLASVVISRTVEATYFAALPKPGV